MKRTISALALFISIAVTNSACASTRKHFRDTAAKSSMLDTLKYDSLMKKLANGDKSGRWPVKTKEYPLPGAILPFNRIVAFYGNLYSKNMGVLGQYPRKTMLNKLKEEVKNWEKADTATNVVPALHYICVTAQADAGRNGLHNLRMPFSQIDTVISWAKSINALVFLDIQVGFSTVQTELPLLEKYMKMPNVHLGIDPEFSMKEGSVPGKRIGTFDADDINYVTGYLAKLVKKNDLPPKIFVVHRFTKRMVTNYKDIKLRPEVQVVMDMDGWGGPELKKGTYKYFISEEPVQFTGFKLFYKNDIKNEPHRMLTPKEVLSLKPAPIYIQYQ
ncbi:hypothetical protein SAMN05192574_104535 [Mucilaginibacter gossypiicola]|uniref:Lipoprotein n=1 Tax=Mucilaginibacter gossypiicola TaxID=551995 RepID=A0A1H8KBK4_9SPHI|nr:hypothetical protein [Mucilaginibacter gossypiicola]SEN90127.1 hypothetical protein SAMN05192574_104535 [Mucilaginibacter gossypiicola]